MTAWIYVNTSKQVGDPEHIKIFATMRISLMVSGDFTRW